jgi:hypothetical protein
MDLVRALVGATPSTAEAVLDPPVWCCHNDTEQVWIKL